MNFEIDREKTRSNDSVTDNLLRESFSSSEEAASSGSSAAKRRAKSSLRLKYEAETHVIERKLGDLESIRSQLGLSQRKIAQLLLVDPSAWTRWTKLGETAPPHIYRMLQWYLALEEKYPALDVNFWLNTVAQIPHPQVLLAQMNGRFDDLRSDMKSDLESELSAQLAKQLTVELTHEPTSEIREKLRAELRDDLQTKLRSELDSQFTAKFKDRTESELNKNSTLATTPTQKAYAKSRALEVGLGLVLFVTGVVLGFFIHRA